MEHTLTSPKTTSEPKFVSLTRFSADKLRTFFRKQSVKLAIVVLTAPLVGRLVVSSLRHLISADWSATLTSAVEILLCVVFLSLVLGNLNR
jgi:hypothetical protein